MANYVSQVTLPDGTSYDVRELFPHVGNCTDAAATAAKTVTIGNFKLYTGAWVVVKFSNTNSADVATLTLNVDGTGAKPIKYKNANLGWASQLLANRYTHFIYDGTNYQIIGDFNTDTYDRTSQQTRIYAGTVGVFNYSLCALDNNQRMQSFTTTAGTGTSKTFNTSAKFMYPAVIMFNAANSTYANGSAIANNVLYEQYPSVDLRYSCNKTASAGFAQYKPVYLECTLNSDDTLSITTNGLTQTFVTGKYYLLLGCMYNTSVYQLALFAQHPLFYYDGTNLNCLVFSAAEKTKLAGIEAGANKYVHPTYPSKTSGLYKITVDGTGHVSGTDTVTASDLPTHTHLYAGSASAGGPATQIATTVTNGTTTLTKYGIVFVDDPAVSEGNAARKNNDFRVNFLNGTTSSAGYTELVLGNNKTSTTADNKYGMLTLYSPGANLGFFKTDTLSENRTYTFPNNTGTVALISDIPTISATTTGSGNAVTSISYSNGVITGNKGNSFLPLSGGTITNSEWQAFKIKRTGTQSAGVHFENNNGYLGAIGMNTVNGPLMRWETDSSTSYDILDTSSTSFTQVLSSGTKIGTIKINDVSTDLYCQTNTDENVLQSNTTTSADYRVLLSGNANDTTETTTGRKSTKLRFNPSSGGLYSFGFLWTDITGLTLDINTLTLSDGKLHSRRFIEKTDGGSTNITNIPVAGRPFLLEVDLIRWASTTDYITRQRFTNAANGTYSYVRYCTNGTWSSWTTRIYTDTDTKVTSSANHYTPATASGSDISKSASGATAEWGIDVVKGVTLNTDGKGHVTGISVTPGKIPPNPVPSNNVTGSGTSGYLVKWNGTNSITNGPQLGSSTTTFLRNDGTWATPTDSDTKVNVTLATTTKAYLLGTSTTPTATAQAVTSLADTGVYLDTTAGGLCATNVKASSTVCANTANSNNAGGIALYGIDPETYGVMFRGTSNSGKHGYVQSDWATYFTMNSNAPTRGWIFRRKTDGTFASISAAGHAVFNGSVTVGGNSTNTSGCRMEYNSTTQSLDFVFV